MILVTLLTFLIPLYLFASVTSTPVKRRPKHNQGKVYKVVLLDREGNRLKGYTYIK